MLIVDKGENFTIPFQMLNSSGGVVDITSATVTCTVKVSPSSTETVFQKVSTDTTQIEKITGTNGLGIVKILVANTSSLTYRDYYYEITDATNKIAGFVRFKQNLGQSPLITNRYENLSSLADDSELVFALSATPISGTLLLFLNGVKQIAGTDYTLSGVTITMTLAPSVTDLFEAYYAG